MKKLTYEYVKNYFKEQGCELLEKEYINSGIKMKYKCVCGNESIINFNKFKMGKRCKKCAGNETYIIEKVKQYFKNYGCELLENEYKNNKTKLKYKCSCKNISKISFSSFKIRHRCKKCGLKELSKKNKLIYEDVKKYFKEKGCELLDKKYNGVHIPMRYRCSCGNISKINFHNFKVGQRCRKCSNNGYSKESQKLFDVIYKKINKDYQSKTYYATLNYEFGINYKGKCFKYDFVNSTLKKAIEYNGKVWHPRLNLKDGDTGWFALNKNKTAKEARDYEKIKYKGLKIRRYKILTIWDYEVKQNFDLSVQKCLDFLMS